MPISNDQSNDQVVITRRRWDSYMLSLFLVAAAIGIFQIWLTGQIRFALVPITIVPIWLMLRLQTPRDGMRVKRIRSTPGAVVLIWFMACALISLALLVAVDIYLFEHSFRSELELYHIALFAPPFLIMFTGTFLADRIAKEYKKSTHRSDKNGISSMDV